MDLKEKGLKAAEAEFTWVTVSSGGQDCKMTVFHQTAVKPGLWQSL